MLLLKDNGSNYCTFNADRLSYDWTGTNPDVALVLCLTNDTSRETINVTLIKEDALGVPWIIGGDRHISGAFLAVLPPLSTSPDAGVVTLEPKGYWEYALYEHTLIGIYPTELQLQKVGGWRTYMKEVDRGKALVVTPTQFTQIRSGTPVSGVTDRGYTNGEVSYTEHTDKVVSSTLDTDENFIHVN